jgi:hypothetical protein
MDNPAAPLAVAWKEPRPVIEAKPENRLSKEILKRRQPLSELILLGEKTEEYRSKLTHIRGRVYLYASKKVASAEDFPDEEARALPRSAIVGSVEIVGCHWVKERIVLRGSLPSRDGTVLRLSPRAARRSRVSGIRLSRQVVQ